MIRVMSDIPAVENNPALPDLSMVRFRVSGFVKEAPRVISAGLPGEIKERDPFVLVFNRRVPTKDNSLVSGMGTTHLIHEAVRKVISEGVYTDSFGTIKEFEAPNGAWWIQITSISFDIVDANE